MRPVVSGVANALDPREVLVLFARLLPHFRLGVPLQDEPGSDARRYFPNCAARQPVEVDPVHFMFARSFRYSNFHLPPIDPELHNPAARLPTRLKQQGADQCCR